MEKTFQLEIMTPEKQFFKGQAEGLIMPALDGEYGVQPGHEPIVTALEPGTVRYCVKGQWDDVIVVDLLLGKRRDDNPDNNKLPAFSCI